MSALEQLEQMLAALREQDQLRQSAERENERLKEDLEVVRSMRDAYRAGMLRAEEERMA